MRPGLLRGTLLVGQALNYFDTALYGFLAPIIAPFFFPAEDPIVRLLLAYSVFALAMFTRPLGDYLFSMLSVRTSPLYTLSFSLMGIAVLMLVFALLPSYDSVGGWAPALLILTRAGLDFFTSGEKMVASFFLLESKEPENAFQWAGIYQAVSIFGVFCASAASIIVTHMNEVDPTLEIWRLIFIGGASIGLVSVILRHLAIRFSPETLAELAAHAASHSTFQKDLRKDAWAARQSILRIIAVTGFSFVIYAFPFVFLNSYAPHVASVTLHQMMKNNTFFLGLSMVLPLFISRFLKKFSARRAMRTAVVMLVLTIPLLLLFLKGASSVYVAGMRLWVVFWWIVFLSPLNVWEVERVRGANRFLLIGIGSSLGDNVLGRNAVPILFACVHLVGHPVGAAIYVVVAGLMAFLALKPLGKGMLQNDAQHPNVEEKDQESPPKQP